MELTYLSVCSGIEAATAAWHALGWKPWAFAQFDPEHKGKGPDFPSAVLATHYPDVPNLGDMTKFEEWPDAVFDVLIGGTPCQSYSVAGLRKGLDDPRGDLMLTYVAIARRYRPRWLAWENVPGVLSDDEGRSFGTLLGLLTGQRVEVPSGGWESAGFVEGYKSAYGVAWRIVDSQFVRVDGFGRAVPQRRRRLFVVGYLGDWRRAAAVLFERESLSGNPAPRRQSGERIAPAVTSGAANGGKGHGARSGSAKEGLIIPVVSTLSESSGHARPGDNITSPGILVPEVANPLTAPMVAQPIAFDCKAGANTGFAIGEMPGALRGEGHGGGHAAVAFQPRFARNGRGAPDEVAAALTGEAGRTGKGDSAQCVAIAIQDGRDISKGQNGAGVNADGSAYTVDTTGAQAVATAWAVRRLTPTECERLQGFPDGYTNIPWRGKNGAPDGHQYKALGNSQSLNVMRWLARRIEMVEEIIGMDP